MGRQTTKRTVSIARNLRRQMSLPEVLLWRALKQSNLKFRKQHPCGPFVADFYCPAAGAIIEIGGIAHDMGDRPALHRARFEWLQGQGYFVLRIPAQDVLKDVGTVANAIVAACIDRID